MIRFIPRYFILYDLVVSRFVFSTFVSDNLLLGFLGGSDGKESTCNVGDLILIPALGRFLEKGMATYSSSLAWRIPMDRGAW